MKTAHKTQQTSLMAFWQLHDLGHRQQQVYKAICKLGTACNLEIAAYLDMPINAITPRTNELVEKGIVTLDRKDISPTGRLSCYWKLVEEPLINDWSEI